jgi:hypothetical protein
MDSRVNYAGRRSPFPATLAEGQGRQTTGEFRQFLGHSRGSLLETETQILLCGRLNYIDNPTMGGGVGPNPEWTDAIAGKIMPITQWPVASDTNRRGFGLY